MQLYDRGIRRRLAPMLEGDRRRIELAYSLMFTLPGTPVLRYGDEIGMGDDLSLPERNCARTPMQWSTEPKRGFTESDKPIAPVISEGAFGYQHVNAAQQRRDPNSMLNWMERIIRMRKEVPEVGWGDFAILATGDTRGARHSLRLAQQLGVFLHNLAASRGRCRSRWDSAAGLRLPPGGCWSTSCRRIIARPGVAAGIGCCSRRMGIDGFGWGDWIIC